VPERPVRVTFLGGLGEIGRNCCAVEVDGRLLVVDVGLMFPEPDMYGVDLILPEFTWLLEQRDRVDGILLTHGHEDHTGGLRYLVGDLRVPVYGSALTLGFARHRLEEAGLAKDVEFIEVADHERRRVGPCDVEFVPVTHSVPSAFALALHTSQGIVVHSGDFKLDLAPIDGRRTDLARLAALGDEGVALLLSDSTNAEEPGFTDSESSVGPALRRLFLERPDRRLVVACFASHLHRIQQVLDAAAAQERKVVLLGRSMVKNVELGRRLGVLRVEGTRFAETSALERLAPSEALVLCTGSQGEPLSALSRLATGDVRALEIGPTDTVVLSSHPIPGNEFSVGRVIDDLHRRGAEVLHSAHEPVHVSGHARQGELETLLQLVRPGAFVPVHGEYRHLVHHAELARRMGVPADAVLLCEDGDSVVLDGDGLRRGEKVPAGFHYVDGHTGDVDDRPLEDRRMLASDGVVLVAAGVDLELGKLVAWPSVSTRGWFDGDAEAALLHRCAEQVARALDEALDKGDRDPESLNRVARRAAGRFLGQSTRRSPVVLGAVVAL
jgi:ribonuclease J